MNCIPQILYAVVLFAAIYVLGKVLFDWPSPRMQRRTKLVARGAAGSTLTGLCAYIGYRLVYPPSLFDRFGSEAWYVTAILVALGVVAVCVWIEFYRLLRSGISK